MQNLPSKTAITALMLFCAGSAFAQTTPSSTWSAPPMVPAGPPPAPAPEPAAPPATLSPAPGTPPPPSMIPPPGSASGSQDSPYGQPRAVQKPGPEIGLMVSESLFGMLTAASIVVLPYFLLFGGANLLGGAGDRTITDIIFIAIFAAVPLAVAQTQVSLANGSRYWFSEMWPTALAGLAGQAAVVGLYYLTLAGQTPGSYNGSVPLLFIGAIAVVPLIQMALINLIKQPKMPMAGLNFKAGEGFAFGLPTPSPIVAQTTQGMSVGAQLSFLNAQF